MTRYASMDTLRAALADSDVQIVETAYAAPTRTAEHMALCNAGAIGGALATPGRVAQSVVLPLPPSANRYWRSVHGRVVVSAAAKAYKAGVWLQAQHAGLHPFAGPVAIYVHVYRARKAGDLDNANKVLLDSLCGIAYSDDSQIVELHAWRHDDPANPRVEVEVRQVQP